MAGRSSIAALPGDMRERVHDMLRRGASVAAVHAELAAHEYPVSRSAVGRYCAGWAERRAEVDLLVEIDAVASALERDPLDMAQRLGAAAIARATAKVDRALASGDADGADAGTMDEAHGAVTLADRMARAVGRMERAASTARDRTAADAAKRREGQRGGLTPAKLAEVRRAVGLPTGPAPSPGPD